MSGTAPSPQQAAQAAFNANLQARRAVVALGVPEEQLIYSATGLTPAGNPVLNIAPRNVGLITGFLVEVAVNVTTASGTSAFALNPLGGPANIFSNIQFTDLSNNVRINTSGLHLAMLSAMRRRHASGAAFTTDSPLGFGNNVPTVVAAPATIAASQTKTIYMVFEIPLAYGMDDLRGAIYANVINATMNLQMTFNPNFQLGSGDTTGTVYKWTGTAATINSYSVNVYQQYIDQIPPGKNGPILPQGDLSTIYEIKNTNFTGLAVGQDFPLPYANFRAFLSTMVVFDNGGTLNPGTDINYISLQSANFVNIFKLDPNNLAFKHRNWFLDDAPAGMYLINTRKKPVSTIQYGNMQLNLNASTVNAGATVLVGYEAMAQQNAIFQAGSLAGG